MADPQNLNQASPSALSTGAPPKVTSPLTPAPPTPSTAAGVPTSKATRGSTAAPSSVATPNNGPAPGALGKAGSGAPAQPGGVGLGDTCTGKGGGSSVTINGAVLQSIAVTPANPTPTIGQDVQMTATGTYSDGTILNITSSVVWAVVNPAIGTITNGSAGGLLTGAGVGATSITATLAPASPGSTGVTVTGSVVAVSGPIPDATGAFGGASAVLAYAIKVPSDATQFFLKCSNRTGTGGGVGSNIASNIAVYQSNGAGLPTGPSLGTFNAQTVPGNGTELTLGPIAVTRGTDGCIVVLYSIPALANTSQAQFQTWGAYVNGTTTVDPAPGGWTPYTLGLLWLVPQFITAKRRVVVLGNSISVGASPVAPPGFLACAWNNIANDKGYCMAIFGQSGTRLNQWADPATYPALWTDELFTGADAYIELGVNDLATDTAAQMEASLTVIVNHVRASGAVNVYANTIAPDSTYIGADAQRLLYNAFVRANSLGLAGVVDLAKSQATGGMANNGDPTLLFAGFDAGDGIHWNAAGHLQAAAAIEAVIG